MESDWVECLLKTTVTRHYQDLSSFYLQESWRLCLSTIIVGVMVKPKKNVNIFCLRFCPGYYDRVSWLEIKLKGPSTFTLRCTLTRQPNYNLSSFLLPEIEIGNNKTLKGTQNYRSPSTVFCVCVFAIKHVIYVQKVYNCLNIKIWITCLVKICRTR